MNTRASRPSRTRAFPHLALALLFSSLASSLPAQTAAVRVIRNTGPNETRVNVAILGDGYTSAQQDQFFADAQRKLTVLVDNEAFTAARDLINGVAIFLPSNEAGTDIAADGIAKDTYYDTGFSGAVNARLLTLATAAGRTRAQSVLREHAPDYDIAIMLVNSTLYGGAGGTPTVVSLHTSSDEVLLHEIGHSFARLTDEYVDEASAPSYPPEERLNATQKTARLQIPWRDFILDATPVPTTEPNTNVNLVGLWEGAHYRARGFYRPVYDSKMRSLNRGFGPVNLQAFTQALHRLNLNRASAAPSALALAAPETGAATGGRLTLTASAEGVGPLTYQWSRDGKFLAGQTNAALELAGLSAASAGTYAVIVTNAAGATSSAATGLTVRVAAETTGGATSYTARVSQQSVLRWQRPAWTFAEEVGTAVLTVNRSGSLAGALTVSFATASGTATSPGDFTAQSGTLSWAEGEGGPRTISIPILTDATVEGPESFTVSLSNPSAGLIVDGADVTVTLAEAGTRDAGFNSIFINNGITRIVPLPDGTVLVAGFFSSVQDSFGANFGHGRVARLRADGTLDPSFKPGTGADGTIHAVAVQADGKILLGGDFTRYDGTARSRLARIHPDGTLDPSFNPGAGADRIIYDLLVHSDGRILVAGNFTSFNGTAREYLVRLQPDGAVDPSFTGPEFAGTSGWWVRSLTPLSNGRVMATGNFYFPGAQLRAGICRLTASGSVDATFDGIGRGATVNPTSTSLSEIRRVVVLPDERLLICGSFGSYNQTARGGLARLTATGALDPTFDPGTGGDQPIEALLVQADGKILIGGRFTAFNGAAANRIARLTPDGTIDPSFVIGSGASATINTLAVQADGHVLVGTNVGSFQGSTASRPLWRIMAAALPATTPTVPTTPTTPTTPTSPATQATGRLVNLSILTQLTAADDAFTVGVVVGGAGTSGTKPLLIRAAGPSLVPLGIEGSAVLSDPRLELFTGSTRVSDNDNWGGGEALRTVMVQVGAFAFTDAASRDAALSLPNLSSGGHSARISGTGAGTVIAELYDASPAGSVTAATPRLVNVSVLKHLGAGLTAGFVLGGASSRTVLVRAVGPTLGAAPFNVPGVVADPQLELFSGQASIGANDNWGGGAALTAAFAQVGAFALPSTSRDAALLVTLTPGSYTVRVAGAAGTTGAALVEVYEVP